MEPKDYVSLTFSAVALAASLYALWRSRRDEHLIRKQKWNQMRFEAVLAVIDARSQVNDAVAVLTGVRFEARRARDTEVVTAIDRLLGHLESALTANTSLENSLRETPQLNGTIEELDAFESVLGDAKATASKSKQYVQEATGVASAARQKLQLSAELEQGQPETEA